MLAPFAQTDEFGNSHYSGLAGNRLGGVVGANNGELTGCRNAGAVSGSERVGGVVGFVSQACSVLNCCNTGTVMGETMVGGVIGIINVDGCRAVSCYNTGAVTGETIVGGVVDCNTLDSILGYTGGAFISCCYLDSTAELGCSNVDTLGEGGFMMRGKYELTPVTEAEGQIKRATAEKFSDGAVTYLLNSGQEISAWGQAIGADALPVLTDEADKVVYKVEFIQDNEEYAAKYANPDGTVALLDSPRTRRHTHFISGRVRRMRTARSLQLKRLLRRIRSFTRLARKCRVKTRAKRK